MTVDNENVKGSKEHSQIKFVEFLEFIGRLAWLQWLDSERHEVWALHKKCFHMLKSLFRFIEEEPIDPEDNDELISDSDDEYWNIPRPRAEIALIDILAI